MIGCPGEAGIGVLVSAVKRIVPAHPTAAELRVMTIKIKLLK